MPTYDYQCAACEHEFEAFQRISEEPLVKCPACGKKKLKRLFGAGAGIIFKGSGFYQTDYRSDGYKQKAASESKSSSDSPSASSTSSTTSSSTGGSQGEGGKSSGGSSGGGKSEGKSGGKSSGKS